MKKIYIAGPMSGIPEFNRPLFRKVAQLCKGIFGGVEAVDPSASDEVLGDSQPREVYLRKDFPLLLGCDAVLFLPGWRTSEGAVKEACVAAWSGIDKFFEIKDCFEEGFNYIPLSLSDLRKELPLLLSQVLGQSIPVWAPEKPQDKPQAKPETKPLSLPKIDINDPFPVGEEQAIVDPVSGAVKGRKLPRFELIPPHALWQLACVYGCGDIKRPGPHNWAGGYRWGDSFGAMMRHAWLFWAGQYRDPELNLPHLAQVAWHAFTLMEFFREKIGTDDRLSTLKLDYGFRGERKEEMENSSLRVSQTAEKFLKSTGLNEFKD